MDGMDIARVVMWAISLLLVPALAYLFKRVRDLELKMETRISQREAATMIKESKDQMDKRFDKLEEILMDVLKKGN